ncbi:hypothetical protein FEM48_Zijuj03G0137100 [Ziziphus jujuba var. spinosa]|uniref:Uncharacterized protein n=1 Tax=Ziziphus jujuba var. spinosa TaxID=714518 RepID=A0A978VQM8_ZIZJJ|nr:hypothetical protein FEM48_Zijuj03G0137100 [Ziziphus jujuba var. spinosa]
MASNRIAILWEIFFVVILFLGQAVASRELLNVQAHMLYVKNEEQFQNNMSPEYQNADTPYGFDLPPTYISDVKEEELLFQAYAPWPEADQTRYHTADPPDGYNFVIHPTGGAFFATGFFVFLTLICILCLCNF